LSIIFCNSALLSGVFFTVFIASLKRDKVVAKPSLLLDSTKNESPAAGWPEMLKLTPLTSMASPGLKSAPTTKLLPEARSVMEYFVPLSVKLTTISLGKNLSNASWSATSPTLTVAGGTALFAAPANVLKVLWPLGISINSFLPESLTATLTDEEACKNNWPSSP